MGRGKPFKKSLTRLVAAGVVPRPVWLDIVEATKPPFQPIRETKAREIVYPEDRLRNIYLQRNPDARKFAINLNARSLEERHIADRFVSIQISIMDEQKLSEDDAFAAAESILRDERDALRAEIGEEFSTSLIDDTITNETAQGYLASVKDARRDQKMHDAMLAEAAART